MEKRILSIIIAIVVVVVLVFSIYQFSGESISAIGHPKGCIDSDGGLNYTVKGTTNYVNRNTEYTDECLGIRELKEYYCLSDAKLDSKKYICTNGCEAGVCLK